MTNEIYKADHGDAIYRRSLYTFWKPAMPPPQMTILNAPNRDACVARRERTNTPSQAPLLLNEPAYLLAARQLVENVLQQANDNEQRLLLTHDIVTGKLPDKREQELLMTLLEKARQKYQAEPKLADELCDGLSLPTAEAKVEHAAWTVLVNTLYNLDVTKMKD